MGDQTASNFAREGTEPLFDKWPSIAGYDDEPFIIQGEGSDHF